MKKYTIEEFKNSHKIVVKIMTNEEWEKLNRKISLSKPFLENRFFDSDGMYTDSEEFLIDDGYEIINFSQIDFEETFVLPNKWAVLRNPDNYQVINKWANENSLKGETPMYSDQNGFIHSEQVDYTSNISIRCVIFYDGSEVVEDFTEIRFEQFEKCVLNKNKEMEKEIIGYKLKKDCEIYDKSASLIVGTSSLVKGSLISEKGYHFHVSNPFKSKAEQAGILELWFEAVYEEKPKFKVGDWLYVPKDEFTSEALFRYKAINNNKYNTDEVYVYSNNGEVVDEYRNVTNFTLVTDKISLATKDQLEILLRRVAISKGFKDGVRYKSATNDSIQKLKSIESLYYENNLLTDFYGDSIYENGKWAEIINSLPKFGTHEGEVVDNHVVYGCNKQYKYSVEKLKLLSTIMKYFNLTSVTHQENVNINLEKLEEMIKAAI